jgi:hypothetical protein
MQLPKRMQVIVVRLRRYAVVVSGYTSTLNVVAAACAAAGIGKISRLVGLYKLTHEELVK